MHGVAGVVDVHNDRAVRFRNVHVFAGLFHFNKDDIVRMAQTLERRADGWHVGLDLPSGLRKIALRREVDGNRSQHRGNNHVDVEAPGPLLNHFHVNETFTA